MNLDKYLTGEKRNGYHIVKEKHYKALGARLRLLGYRCVEDPNDCTDLWMMADSSNESPKNGVWVMWFTVEKEYILFDKNLFYKYQNK